MILLDTNAAIAVMNLRPAAVGEKVVACLDSGERLAVSSIVVFELWYGIANSARRARNIKQLDEFLSGGVEVLELDGEDARVCGDVRMTLLAAGTPIGPYDILIAGQALRHGATLVTANTREFARVPGLRCEDWG
jgi:tRNA(fMet)-specific endonuclease VapC